MAKTACIQCAMRAILAGEPVPIFDESSSEHMKRAHPDPIAKRDERRELERRLADLPLAKMLNRTRPS